MKYKRNPKQCQMCQKEYIPTGNCSKFCSGCSDLNKKQYMKKFHERTYVKKGYSQFRENNNNWKGGIGVYREIKKAEACESCGSTKNLCIHHKDGNRYNNEIKNLECLCKRCHQIEHRCWTVLPKKQWLAELKKEQAAKAKRSKDGRFSK